ncbi:hypothetical protein QTQ03_18865 [Micromonospora sp. WMMA1363]|uniref:hypothetical protein n=1 Tax=Micromonospora sp. WMMA1363 TaxID=3053985 RepID=UPI00259D0470|nr:hypothetical protein [Micromonospora sp. WMMA1363]MDM4721552.1 hypothetical protein [Micromonospora sp. WMMA1363]
MEFGVRPALVGVAASSANADLGAAVGAWVAGAMGRALLGQGADLVGFQLERLAGVKYLPETTTMTPESAAEYEAVSDLRERYRLTALRHFLADDDLDLRRCIYCQASPWTHRCTPTKCATKLLRPCRSLAPQTTTTSGIEWRSRSCPSDDRDRSTPSGSAADRASRCVTRRGGVECPVVPIEGVAVAVVPM